MAVTTITFGLMAADSTTSPSPSACQIGSCQSLHVASLKRPAPVAGFAAGGASNLLCQAACVRVAAVRTSSPRVGAADVGPLIADPLGAPARTCAAALRLFVRCGSMLVFVS